MKHKKVGLYFGSFNPIHIGHLIIAEYIVEHSDLEEVWFILSPNSPYKTQSQLLNEKQRYYMLNLAIEEVARFKASDVEFRLPRPSYTHHTLAMLREQHPQIEFAIIMGEDNLRTLPKWKNSSYIIENFPVYVYPRNTELAAEVLPAGAQIHIVTAPKIELSSSLIRESIKEKRRIHFMLPPKVAAFIDDMNLYK